MSLVVTGTIGIDTVQTPHGQVQGVLGGSAVYFSVAAGLFTRPAAFLASGTMAVAYIQFHWKPWETFIADGKWLPMNNRGEPAVLFCFLFLYLAVRGAGPFSLDRKLRRV